MSGVWRLAVGAVVGLGVCGSPLAADESWVLKGEWADREKTIVKKLNHALYHQTATATKAYNDGDYKTANEQFRSAIEMSAIGIPKDGHQAKTESDLNKLIRRVENLHRLALAETSANKRAVLFRTAINDLRNAHLRHQLPKDNVETLVDRLGGEEGFKAIKSDLTDALVSDNPGGRLSVDQSFFLGAVSAHIDRLLGRRVVAYRVDGSLVELLGPFVPLTGQAVVMSSPVVGTFVTAVDYKAAGDRVMKVLRRNSVPEPEIEEVITLLKSGWPQIEYKDRAEPYKPFE